jgi:hypothetical protein
MPLNIQELAEKNTALMERLGFEFEKDNPDDLIDEQVYLDSGLFDQSSVDQIFHNTPHVPEVQSEAIPAGLGAILIRPEMTYAVHSFHSFISDRFRIIYDEPTQLTPDQYWTIYGDAIVDREADFSRLTRASIFIGSNCRLLVFIDPVRSENQDPLADDMVRMYKGEQGVYSPGTLRGDVVYRNAIASGFHTLPDEYCDETLIRALDPFGAYRQYIAKNKTALSRFVHPILRYVGVGVHIPSYEEIKSDLVTILIPEERSKLDYAAHANMISGSSKA